MSNITLIGPRVSTLRGVEGGEQPSPSTVSKYHGQACPAERLNGRRYAENWLENLLVSGSMNGVEMDQQIPL